MIMALSIKHPEADRLARELARETGESLTEAVLSAIRERLERERGRRSAPGLRDDIARMQERLARLPRLDARSDEAILGYDEHGLPA
jgi:antitoxin VapB